MDFVSIRIITDDIARLVEFYEKATGIPATWSTEDFAELRTPSATLAIGSTTISTPNSGVVPVIFSSLAGSGATGGQGRNITFSGGITLSAAANTYVGRTTVTQSNIFIGSNGNLAYSAPFGAAGNMLTLDTSILTANGSHTGASVAYQLPYNIKIIGNNTICLPCTCRRVWISSGVWLCNQAVRKLTCLKMSLLAKHTLFGKASIVVSASRVNSAIGCVPKAMR